MKHSIWSILFAASIFAVGCGSEPTQEAVAEEESVETSSTVTRAEFPGGINAVLDFIAGNVEYPESARADQAEGKVFVEFTVTETGEVANARVLESLHPSLDSAALATAMSMPNWAPATKAGKPISTTITLPVMFKMN